MAKKLKNIVPSEERQQEDKAASKLHLPKASSTEVIGQQSAMNPAIIIPPKLKEEGFDMGTAFIFSDPAKHPKLKGVQFYVKTLKPEHARHRKTVIAKSLTHTWEGTPKEFKEQFEKA